MTISEITVSPAEPRTRQHFTLSVSVKNVGEASSGQYDLEVLVEGVSVRYKDEDGSFENEGLEPGEEVVAYSSTDKVVNKAGDYQVYVEIIPFSYEDITGNNPATENFSAKKKKQKRKK